MKTIKDKITTCNWCFQSNFISIKKWFKKYFNNLICFVINHDLDGIIFECITLSLSLSLKEIKLISIFNWIFHPSNFWDIRLSLSYSSTDSVLFLSPLHYLQYNFYFTYLYWFIVILFFMLLHALIFSCFFQSKKILIISLTVVCHLFIFSI